MPVEEFDDLSEEEAALTESELRNYINMPPPIRGQDRLFLTQEDRNLYNLCENVEDLL